MVDAPERIWAFEKGSLWKHNFWQPSKHMRATEYVRADLFAKKEEEFLSKSRELIRLQSELSQTRRKALDALQFIADHPEAYDDGKQSYAVGWAFWNIQNKAKSAIRALIEKEA